MPDGYCVPDGSDRELLDLTASGDKQNITPVSLIRCERRNHPDGIGFDYVLIKAPRKVLAARIDRAEFLKMMAPEMGKADWQDHQGQEILGGVSKDMSDALGSDISVTGSIGPHGVDSDCAYLGGTLEVETITGKRSILVGGCMTTTGEKIMTVNTYAAADTPGGVARQMRRAHDLAMQIRPAP
ncbi:MAG: hypothetical protein IE934_04755 [Sphingopyxis sp.]|nr:hypothetical protein [Sphingopyxis sp.]